MLQHIRDEVPADLASRATAPEEPPGPGAGILPALNHYLAVHDHVGNAFTELVRVRECGAIHHALRIEDDQLGQAPRTDQASVEAAQPLRRQ